MPDSTPVTKCLSIPVILLLCFLAVSSAGAATRRILLVGDSWPMFMWDGLGLWTGRAFQDALAARGLGEWEELGGRTTIGTSMATEWANNAPTFDGTGRLDVLRAVLQENPSIDIVHLSIGGNDYGSGDYSNRIDYVPFDMQTIVFDGTPTGGTFALTFNGATTDPIPFDAAAGDVQAKLEALATIGAGNIEVIDANGRPRYFCTFKGTLGHTLLPPMTADGTLLTNSGIHVTGVQYDHGWKKDWGYFSPAEIAFFEGVCAATRVTVEACLEVRPDLRVALCDYEYMQTTRDGATLEETSMAGMRFGAFRFLLTQEMSAEPRYRNRCLYVEAGGLMQWTFGYPDPVPLGESQIYGPLGTPGTGGSIPRPKCNLQKWGISIPSIGGDMRYPSPDSCMLYDWGTSHGQAIHLNKQGYTTLAGYCIDEFYGEWLNFPKVISVKRSTPNPIDPRQVFDPTGLNQVSFEVVFSKPVTGVDEADFDAIGGAGLAHPSILSVTEGKDGATYEVLVNTGSGNGTLTIGVKDNGSIRDAQSNDLCGDIDGSFSSGEKYTISRAVQLPVIAWPAALVLLSMGVIRLRKKPQNIIG